MTTNSFLASPWAGRWHDFWHGDIGEWILTRGLRIALLLIGGAVSYSLGRKRSADWQAETARVRVLPSFGGLTLQGRF